MSQQNGFGSGFILGSIIGGVMGGVLGTVLSSRTRNERKLDRSKDRFREGEHQISFSSEAEMELARHGLEDKIAQLNLANR